MEYMGRMTVVDITADDVPAKQGRLNIVEAQRALAFLVLLGLTSTMVSDLVRRDRGCTQVDFSSDFSCAFR
jgi:hypothetical protein